MSLYERIGDILLLALWCYKFLRIVKFVEPVLLIKNVWVDWDSS